MFTIKWLTPHRSQVLFLNSSHLPLLRVVIFFGVHHVPMVKGKALHNPFPTHLARAIAMNLAVHDKCAGSALEKHHDDVGGECSGK